MDQRKKCADICDVAQVTDVSTLPNQHQLVASVARTMKMFITKGLQMKLVLHLRM